MIEKANSVDWGAPPRLLNFSDEGVDPFSFFYFLASKNTTHQFPKVYASIHEQFQLNSEKISDYPGSNIFPAPGGMVKVLFHDGKNFYREQLWTLFRQAVGQNDVNQDNFNSVLNIRNVGVTKLTQTLFLMNPTRFGQIDQSIEVILGKGRVKIWKKEIETEGYPAYARIEKEIFSRFPGCFPYEFNLFIYLQGQGGMKGLGDLINKESRFFLVNSEVFGDNVDVFDGSHPENKFPTFQEGSCVYTDESSFEVGVPIDDTNQPRKGDIVLVRNGANQGRGIGVVYENEYSAKGWSENKAIRVIWICRSRSTLRHQYQRVGLSEISPQNDAYISFKEAYSTTFNLIDSQRPEEKRPVVGVVPEKGNGSESINPKVPISGPLNTILYGPPGTGKTYTTFRKCVEICDGSLELATGDVRARYHELREKERIEFVTFHQSYSYEEFVEGLRPESGDDKSPGFSLKPENGVIKKIADRARMHSDRAYVLVIDEINRANVAKVLGEMVTLLEEDKRQGQENEISVKLPYSRVEFSLPSNLHILGTMNTADRSIALLDTALRRRFQFKEIPPDPLQLSTIDEIDLPNVLRAINNRLEWFIDRDHLIGHAWFIGATSKAQIDSIMHDKIIPLIVEYFYEDWDKVQSVLGGGDSFIYKSEITIPPGFREHTDDKRYNWILRDAKDYKLDAYSELIRGGRSNDEN